MKQFYDTANLEKLQIAPENSIFVFFAVKSLSQGFVFISNEQLYSKKTTFPKNLSPFTKIHLMRVIGQKTSIQIFEKPHFKTGLCINCFLIMSNSRGYLRFKCFNERQHPSQKTPRSFCLIQVIPSLLVQTLSGKKTT